MKINIEPIKGYIQQRRNSRRGRKFVALDFDHRYLRVVAAESGHTDLKVDKVFKVAVPEHVSLLNAKQAGQWIGQVLAEHRLTQRWCVMNVPRSRAIIKPLSLPPIEDEKEIPSMVRYQVEKELPFPADEAVIDYTIESMAGMVSKSGVSEDEGTMNILVAAVRRSVVEYYQSVAEAGDINLQQLCLRPYADHECLHYCVKEQLSGQHTALIHLAADEAEINVYNNGILSYCRAAPIKTISEESGVRTQQDIINALAVEAMRSFQSVGALRQGAAISHIWIGGDTQLEDELAEKISNNLSVPCELLHPFDRLKVKSEIENRDGFISAIGLALGNYNGHRLPLDFLHPKKPPIERNMARIYSIAGGSVAAAVAAVAIVIGIVKLANAEIELNKVKAVYNDVSKTSKQVEKIEKRLSALSSWTDEQQDWLDHWAYISSLLPSASEVIVSSLSTTANGDISFNVKAKQRSAITQLTTSLRKAGYQIKLGTEAAVKDDLNYIYATTVRLSPTDDVVIKVSTLESPGRPADDVYQGPGSGSGSSRSNRSSGDSRFNRTGNDSRTERSTGASSNTRSSSDTSGNRTPNTSSSTRSSGDSDDNRSSGDSRSRSSNSSSRERRR